MPTIVIDPRVLKTAAILTPLGMLVVALKIVRETWR